ncbi:MAG TPA: hypothetical protein PLQ85_09765 [Anaerolineae bacterium]|nr:hypothetical protein [Anaerolineae bacterium]
MNFTEAEQRFHFLEDQRQRGVLSLEQYRAELAQLRVTDAWGRLWMLQEQTGQWFVFHEGQWRPSQPPQQAPPPPPAPTPVPYSSLPQAQQIPAQPAPAAPFQPSQLPPAQPQEEKSGGCGKWLLYGLLWVVIWSVIAVGVYFIADQEPMAVAGVGLAALISLVFMLATLSSHWQGTIVDVRMERERVSDHDEDGSWHWETVTYAYVRRSNGKVKKMRAMPNWDVGDRLEKRRGESQIRHYPHG